MLKAIKLNGANFRGGGRSCKRQFGTKIMLTPLPNGFEVHQASPSFIGEEKKEGNVLRGENRFH